MASLRTPDFEKLIQQLHAEHTALEALHSTLLLEQDHLSNPDIDTLQQITDDKTLQVEQINTLVGERTEYLASLGFDNDADGIQAILDKAPSRGLKSEAQALWEQNQALLQDCHKQNQVNGIVIETGVQSTQLVLDILQSPPTPRPEATTYDKKGRTNQSNGKPPLAKA